MKKNYISPEFDLVKLLISNVILNPSTTDEEPVPGGPGEDPIEE